MFNQANSQGMNKRKKIAIPIIIVIGIILVSTALILLFRSQKEVDAASNMG
jgi:flagellar basal body-associated protein FliL